MVLLQGSSNGQKTFVIFRLSKWLWIIIVQGMYSATGIPFGGSVINQPSGKVNEINSQGWDMISLEQKFDAAGTVRKNNFAGCGRFSH
jgi:hypothetical protein